ncbi:hypothetical protein [Helicobacter trogontum]|uniref:hypothetical protein n=1 Tax=Helicobacter trogontum TaxID=50960 RepID=UPI00242CE63C|nr:hypothetical protein [Helicobacter trogontum]MCI5787679.1 hypothetical protein [Helicobacter trogontum]MDY5185820.1 hypothetical protein [Helicobacter trogontum]
MKIGKYVKTAVLASVLMAGSAQALPFISPEVGGIVGTNIDVLKSGRIGDDTNLTYGAYGRLWLKPGSFRIAPFVKWENITGFTTNNLINTIISGGDRNNNIQYGAVVGLEFFYITPYVGVAYSQFTNETIADTWALNYGLKFKIPFLPLAIGVDASWQKPKVLNSSEVDMHRIGVTLGLHF